MHLPVPRTASWNTAHRDVVQIDMQKAMGALYNAENIFLVPGLAAGAMGSGGVECSSCCASCAHSAGRSSLTAY